MTGISFILNDREVSTSAPPGSTVLDFIREGQHLKGTKIGCREGDCGACTVLVGELKSDSMLYRSMTSCLMPLANAQGRHLVSIEGLNGPKLRPFQWALLESSGTQCGFCTPGFVVSLAGFCLQDAAPTKEGVVAAMDGNICRCTGYQSIVQAGHRVADMLRDKPQGRARLSWLVEREMLPAYFQHIPQRLQNLKRAELPVAAKAGVVAGGSDLLVQKPEEIATTQPHFIFNNAALKGIELDGDHIRIAAATTTTDLLESPLMRTAVPRLQHFLELVSSTPIRNMGTVAGNLVNASPIGDLTALFMALGTSLELRQGEQTRKVRLQDFYRGYKQMDLQPEEHVVALHFPQKQPQTRFNFEKVSKRIYLDIASVNTALRLEMDGEKVASARLSAGGVAPVPAFLKEASAALQDQTISPQTVKAVAQKALAEVAPISDARGSADYKRLLLRQLIYAHFITLFPEQISLEAL